MDFRMVSGVSSVLNKWAIIRSNRIILNPIKSHSSCRRHQWSSGLEAARQQGALRPQQGPRLRRTPQEQRVRVPRSFGGKKQQQGEAPPTIS